MTVNQTASVRSMVIDYRLLTIRVELENGSILTEHLNSAPPETAIDRAVFDVAGRTIAFQIGSAGSIVAEVGQSGVADSDTRPVAYLDQNKWIALAQRMNGSSEQREDVTALDRIIDLSTAGLIRLPISAAHLTETTRVGGRRRQELAFTMLKLSRGWQMVSPVRLRPRELVWAFGRYLRANGTLPSREHVFSLDPDILFANRVAGYTHAGPFADLHERLNWATTICDLLLQDEIDDPSDGLAAATEWAASFQALAAHMASNPRARAHRRKLTMVRTISDLGNEVPEAAREAGLSVEQFQAWLQIGQEQTFALMPYLGRLRELNHLKLVDGNRTWEPHDLNDMQYLACAAGYADVVVGEREHTNLLIRGWRGRTGGALVTRRMMEGVERLEGLL